MINLDKIVEIQENIDENTTKINAIIDRTIRPYIKDLDTAIKEYSKQINNTSNPISDETLDRIILELPKLMYWASEGQEILSLKSEFAKIIKSDKIIESLKTQTGSVSEKNLKAEHDAIDENVSLYIYTYSVNKIKDKLGNAMELLQSAKKIISKRMKDNDWSPPYKEVDNLKENPRERRKVF